MTTSGQRGFGPQELAWAYLSRVVEGPCAPLLALIDSVGPQDAARALKDHNLPEVLDVPTQARRHLDTAEEDLRILARLGGRLLTPDDPHWPRWRALAVRGNAEEAPAVDVAPPVALWVRGNCELDTLLERAVAVVGTRAASSYGENVTTEIVSDLAASGWTIVSGGAYGIDACAHRAALAAGAPTVAVLACGLDRVYPAGHARLFNSIAQAGAVLSEYPPGTTPMRFRFLSRNRLVAAFTDATVVTEAGKRSGARNTARWARTFGKPVFAVPGSIFSASSVGCHTMITTGEAQIAVNAEQVEAVAGPINADAKAVGEPSQQPGDKLEGAGKRLYEALEPTRSRSARELSVAAGVPLERVHTVLGELEAARLAATDQAGWFRRS